MATLPSPEKGFMNRQTFVQGALLLGLASFVSRLLGTVYKIPYQNITGDLGFYVYNQVYPLYAMLLVLSTAGFPIAISKLVSERLVTGDRVGANRIYLASAAILTLSGVFFFFLLFFGAPLISAWMGGGELLVLPLRSVSFALIIVPAMAVMRGYFQGHQNMVPTALSQTVEQVVRIATILLLSYLMISWYGQSTKGVVYAASGAVFGAFTGAGASLLVLLFFRRADRLARSRANVDSPAIQRMQRGHARESFAAILRQILRYAIPISIGSLVLPLFNIVDAFSVKTLLETSAGDNAAVLKGIYDRGPTLIQFAAFFATAISLSLVPSLTESMMKGQRSEGVGRAMLAIRLTLLLGLPASVGLAVLARPINVMLFTDDSGTLAIAVGAVTILFSTISITCTGILQGIGQMGLPARNLLIAIGVKAVLNLLLIPLFSISGAALATVLAYAVASWLNMRSCRRYLPGVGLPPMKEVVRLLLVVAAMAASVTLVLWGGALGLFAWTDEPRLEAAAVSLCGVSVGTGVFVILSLRLGVVRLEDIGRIPKTKRLVVWLSRRRWATDRNGG